MNKNMTFDSMMGQTIHCRTIFTKLFLQCESLSAEQMAKDLGTTTSSVRSRISEIRGLGYTIRCLTNDGRNFFYQSDRPTAEETALARRQGLEGFYDPAPMRIAGLHRPRNDHQAG